MAIANVCAPVLEPQIGHLHKERRDNLADPLTPDRRQAVPMLVEHRVLGVHGHDRVWIVLRPRGYVPHHELGSTVLIAWLLARS